MTRGLPSKHPSAPGNRLTRSELRDYGSLSLEVVFVIVGFIALALFMVGAVYVLPPLLP